jgi:hypothetical protein
MRILSAIPALFALALLALGVMALFGIGITGLLFLVPGAMFAVTALLPQENSRAAVVVAFASRNARIVGTKALTLNAE